jgi:repressor LexA
MLTQKQRALLAFIAECIDATGAAPTYPEMIAATGCGSKGNLAFRLTSLERLGFIRRDKARPRGITVLRMPDANPLPDLIRDIVAHFKPELAGLRHDCADVDGGPTDPSLLAFIETGEALIARAEAALGGR